MKKIIIVLLVFLLSGCDSIILKESTSLIDDIDAVIEEKDLVYDVRTNNTTYYYSYYLPSDVYELDGNLNAAYLNYKDAEFIINLNISNIVNSRDYTSQLLNNEGFYDETKLFYNSSGTFLKNDETVSNYVLNVYQDEYYLVYFLSDELICYGVSNKYDLTGLINKIFIIAKAIEVDKNFVISEYSTKNVIDSVYKPIDLFSKDENKEGYLQDLVEATGGYVVNASTLEEERAKQDDIPDEDIIQEDD